jgi:lipoprotein-anchoring transpeptidase ErfK/SrfK
MDHRPFLVGSLAVIGAVLLGGCATTAISSSIVTTTTSTTPPVAPIAEPEAMPVDESVVVASPESTVAPTTTVEPLVREIVEVSALDTAIPAIGTSSGAEATRLQQRLLDLGYWVQATDGEYGLTTRQAVMAFQKYEGLTPTGSLDELSAMRISEVDTRPFGRAQAGTMVEVDKAKQLLFVIEDGQTRWVLNASTGSELPYSEPNSNNPDVVEEGDSVTPVGLHKVNREREEGWWEGDLGQIYRPKYFRGGVAVHGANSVPEYPASHGCVRVSVPAMDWIWTQGLLPIGSLVWVHGDIPGASDGA